MLKEELLKQFMKEGYSREKGKRVWHLNSHKHLYATPELARGFLSLKKFSRYKKNVIDREIALIKKHVPRLFGKTEESFNIIGLGCGDGVKAEHFIRGLGKRARVRYCPIDFSKYLLRMAAEHVRKSRLSQVKAVRPAIGDFEYADEFASLMRNSSYPTNIFLLFGNTLASFEINDFLFHLSKNMFRGDYLIIGNGIRTGKRFVGLNKYRHPLFESWFINVMKELGFRKDEVKYDVRFANGRLEFFYHVLADKIVSHKNKKVSFRKGDKVIVAIQYKYYARELEKFCKMYFLDVKPFKDSSSEYALIFCRK